MKRASLFFVAVIAVASLALLMALVPVAAAKDMATSPAIIAKNLVGEDTDACVVGATPIKCILVGAQALGEVALNMHVGAIAITEFSMASTANKEDLPGLEDASAVLKCIHVAAAGFAGAGMRPMMLGRPLPDIVQTSMEIVSV